MCQNQSIFVFLHIHRESSHSQLNRFISLFFFLSETLSCCLVKHAAVDNIPNISVISVGGEGVVQIFKHRYIKTGTNSNASPGDGKGGGGVEITNVR